ncbi:MAG: hypothetical protein HC824_18070 [Synechococcales cyanobacterium RM1_1_8]|nr:hypothetical protein [Synechococcales cyanobacterium RM1_1_8]
MVDIGELVADIDRYPEAAGIDPDIWQTLTYTQKVKILIQRQLQSVQTHLDNLERDTATPK